MRSVRLLVLSFLMALLPTLGVPGLAVAADPNTTVTLVVSPNATTVGSAITATATVTRFGTPVMTGRVMFDVESTGDYGPTGGISDVVDGTANFTFQGGLVAGSRTMTATYLPVTGVETASLGVAFTVSRAVTTTAVALTPHPTIAGRTAVVPTISHAGGAITKGECTLYIDDVPVGAASGGLCGTSLLPLFPPGTLPCASTCRDPIRDPE